MHPLTLNGILAAAKCGGKVLYVGSRLDFWKVVHAAHAATSEPILSGPFKSKVYGRPLALAPELPAGVALLDLDGQPPRVGFYRSQAAEVALTFARIAAAHSHDGGTCATLLRALALRKITLSPPPEPVS
ncbi:MAG: hypothetical protein AAGK03_03435 [Pseudomonadota bacterium]